MLLRSVSSVESESDVEVDEEERISIPLIRGSIANQNNVSKVVKAAKRNYFDWYTIFKTYPQWLRTAAEVLLLAIFLHFCNWFVRYKFFVIVVQFTVGWGGNVLWWPSNAIITPDDSRDCVLSQLHWLHSQQPISQQFPFDISPINDANDPNPQCTQLRNTQKIPKIIHQTYKSFEEIPEHWMMSMQRWKYYHPDYEYMFWSDEDIRSFMETHYGWFIPFFDSYENNIQRIDAVRYFILYHYGGIYSDFDVIPKRNIESLLQSHDDVVIETPNLGLTNAIFATKKGSAFMFHIIDNLPSYKKGWYLSLLSQHMQILLSTGPTMFWSAYARYHHLYGNTYEAVKAYGIDNVDTSIGVVSSDHFGRLSVCSPNPGHIQKDWRIPGVEIPKAEADISEADSSIIDAPLNKLEKPQPLPQSPVPLTAIRRLESALVHTQSKTKQFLGCDKALKQNAYFRHVEGNSWHSDGAWLLNFFVFCHPISSLFILFIALYSIYVLGCQMKSMATRWQWLTKNAAFAIGLTLILSVLFFGRYIWYVVLKVSCE